MREMNELINLIKREAARSAGANRNRIGKITSYDPQTYAVKVMLLPDNVETGWVPMSAPFIGNGFGIAVGPSIGDMVIVDYHEGDQDSPFVVNRIYSKKTKAPVAQSGEIVIQHQSGALIKIDQTGAMTITVNGQPLTVTAPNININGDVTISGALDVNGGHVNHGGTNIGNNHVHGGVQSGPSTTSNPQ